MSRSFIYVHERSFMFVQLCSFEFDRLWSFIFVRLFNCLTLYITNIKFKTNTKFKMYKIFFTIPFTCFEFPVSKQSLYGINIFDFYISI
ncbi:hypothetical protein HanIR_Chr05g0242671 [Helianthus annuus]|nr:hypothetical protein HanIR_Chr05g0242671 [Helianthus annuus]